MLDTGIQCRNNSISLSIWNADYVLLMRKQVYFVLYNTSATFRRQRCTLKGECQIIGKLYKCDIDNS